MMATKATAAERRAQTYLDGLSDIMADALDGNLSRQDFIDAAMQHVSEQLTAEFRRGANVPEGDNLTPEEAQALTAHIAVHRESVQKLADTIQAARGLA